MSRVVKSGYLRRYSRKFMSDGWKDVWVVLYSDSSLAWFKNQGDSSRKGQANMKAVGNYFAVGQYAKNVPGLPPLPAGTKLDHIIAIPEAPRRDARVEFLLARSDQELGEWMSAIASTVTGGVQPAASQPMPSPQHQTTSAAPPYGTVPHPAVHTGGGYPAGADGYPPMGFDQPGGYPPQPQPGYQQPPYQPALGYAAPPPPMQHYPVPPQAAVAQHRPYPVQTGMYAYPGQGYAPPVVYAGAAPAAPHHTVIVREQHIGSGGVLAGGGAGLVGGLAAGYLMGSALGGHHHHHYGGGIGLGLGHHWGSWSSLSSFGSFGSWSD